jgi:alkyl hydroperoxide reductase subunit AhpF
MRELLVGWTFRQRFRLTIRAATHAIFRGAAGETTGVRFAAIPLGHELTSLNCWRCCGWVVTAESMVIEQIKGLEGEHRIQVYMSLSCHMPDVVPAAALMAIVSERSHRGG